MGSRERPKRRRCPPVHAAKQRRRRGTHRTPKGPASNTLPQPHLPALPRCRPGALGNKTRPLHKCDADRRRARRPPAAAGAPGRRPLQKRAGAAPPPHPAPGQHPEGRQIGPRCAARKINNLSSAPGGARCQRRGWGTDPPAWRRCVPAAGLDRRPHRSDRGHGAGARRRCTVGAPAAGSTGACMGHAHSGETRGDSPTCTGHDVWPNSSSHLEVGGRGGACWGMGGGATTSWSVLLAAGRPVLRRLACWSRIESCLHCCCLEAG